MRQQGSKDTGGNNHFLYNLIRRYATGWVANSDWTDRHLGTTAGGNLVHNLDATLDQLLIKLFISVTGADTDAFEPQNYSVSGYGITNFYVDSNTITMQTGDNGIAYLKNADGTSTAIAAQSWYYKIVVYKISGKEK